MRDEPPSEDRICNKVAAV